MKIKKTTSLFLALLLLLSVFSLTAFAREEKTDISEHELPKPASPVYLMLDAADRTSPEGNDALYLVRQTDMSVMELSAEYYADSDAFCKKYGLYSFTLVMQYDTSLDGTDNWNYTSAWDEEYSAPGSGEAAGIFWIGEEMMDKETVFDLYYTDGGDRYMGLADAIVNGDASDGFENYYFDNEDHSLYIRVRYYMEWETYDGEIIGERQSKYSEWSDAAIFGKDGNSIIPDAPASYEAPVISDLKYVPPMGDSELGSLSYIQTTPEQVWMAGIYYEMTEDGNFEGLETQISINGGEWQPYSTANDWGDGCLINGSRTAYYEEPRIESDSHVKLRIRFLGTHGPSEWSNVLELSGGGTQEVPDETGGKPEGKPTDEKGKCSLCGFCPVPLGLCIFIWLAIALAVIVLAVIIIRVTKPKKCKSCGEKLKKDDKKCPKCGTEIK